MDVKGVFVYVQEKITAQLKLLKEKSCKRSQGQKSRLNACYFLCPTFDAEKILAQAELNKISQLSLFINY